MASFLLRRCATLLALSVLLAPGVVMAQSPKPPKSLPPPALKEVEPTDSDDISSNKTPTFKVETPEMGTASNSVSPTPQTASASSASGSGASPVYHKTSSMLFGRIEQIAAGTSAKFPVLRAQTAQYDTRGDVPLKGTATQSQLAMGAEVMKSYPQDYSGTWGGSLSIWNFQEDPLYYKLDRNEAIYNGKILQRNRVGAVNFVFARGPKGIELEPAHLLFHVPISDTDQAEQLNSMLGSGQGANSAMAGLLGGMAKTMDTPIMVALGDFKTGGLTRGISGNEESATVLKNEIKELQPGVLEQQIVTSKTQRNPQTGVTNKGYDETVIRFMKQSSDQFYVQVASVSYSDRKQFLSKLILYGTVRKGQVAQTNPLDMPGLGDMSKMLQQMGGAGMQGGMPQGAGQMPNMQGSGQMIEQLQKLLQGQ